MSVGKPLPEEIAHFLFRFPWADTCFQRFLLQQDGQDQGHVFKGGVLVVAVLVEDQGGACREDSKRCTTAAFLPFSNAELSSRSTDCFTASLSCQVLPAPSI